MDAATVEVKNEELQTGVSDSDEEELDVLHEAKKLVDDNLYANFVIDSLDKQKAVYEEDEGKYFSVLKKYGFTIPEKDVPSSLSEISRDQILQHGDRLFLKDELPMRIHEIESVKWPKKAADDAKGQKASDISLDFNLVDYYLSGEKVERGPMKFTVADFKKHDDETKVLIVQYLPPVWRAKFRRR